MYFNGEPSTEKESERQTQREIFYLFKKKKKKVCFCLVLLSQALSAITGMKDFMTEQY